MTRKSSEIFRGQAMREKPGRIASTEFVCALIGMVLGFLFMPAEQNDRPTFDFRDFKELPWIVGGGAIGALTAMILGWAERRFSV